MPTPANTRSRNPPPATSSRALPYQRTSRGEKTADNLPSKGPLILRNGRARFLCTQGPCWDRSGLVRVRPFSCLLTDRTWYPGGTHCSERAPHKQQGLRGAHLLCTLVPPPCRSVADSGHSRRTQRTYTQEQGFHNKANKETRRPVGCRRPIMDLS